MPARLQEHYTKSVREALTKEFSYQNPFQVPKLEKIVINMGVGEAVNDRKAVDGAVADLTAITGQKPVVIKSRTSIATFKLREGMPVGVKVTLRGDRMWDFLDRLISVVLPDWTVRQASANIEQLPQSRRELYNHNRRSKVLIKAL